MIFEQSGVGRDASFMQAVLVGLVNLVFTILAMALIDRVGRRPLLGFGLAGIAACMLTLAYGFGSATYTLNQDAFADLPDGVEPARLTAVAGVTFSSDIEFRNAITAAVGDENWQQYGTQFVAAAIDMNPTLILVGILGFVASFAMSLGPVMWVLFSELFPNQLRGVAISFVGLINSAVSFTVQLVFPWELETIGNAGTFLLYGVFAIVGLLFVMRRLPETKGKTLEELEEILVKH
jgi:MFS family permease